MIATGLDYVVTNTLFSATRLSYRYTEALRHHNPGVPTWKTLGVKTFSYTESIPGQDFLGGGLWGGGLTGRFFVWTPSFSPGLRLDERLAQLRLRRFLYPSAPGRRRHHPVERHDDVQRHLHEHQRPGDRRQLHGRLRARLRPEPAGVNEPAHQRAGGHSCALRQRHVACQSPRDLELRRALGADAGGHGPQRVQRGVPPRPVRAGLPEHRL